MIGCKVRCLLYVRQQAMRSVYTLFCCILLMGCSSHSAPASAAGDSCTTNMTAVYWALHDWIGDRDRFPPTLTSVVSATNSAIFVSPSTGHIPGAVTNIEAWTDYIYVGNGMEGCMCDVALLISPPENHGGSFGYVVWGCGEVVKLPADQIRSLIKQPWCMPTKARCGGFDEFAKPQIQIHIPDRFHLLYGHD